jgi:hypothetical protein
MRTGGAPTWAAYARGHRNVPGPLRGASVAGQPFLADVLGDGARLLVEIAWGADLAAASATWAWTDITADVYQEPAINFRYGRQEGAGESQPANCTMTLDNPDGRYSLGGESPNWPNVRKGTPVRIRIDPNGTGFQTVFQGNAVGFKPGWVSLNGRIAVVRLTVGGTLRRLIQGSNPVVSIIRRSTLALPNLIAYWTCEAGENATLFDSALGDMPMTWIGFPDLASNTSFVASQPLPVLKKSEWSAPVPDAPDTGAVQVRFMGEFSTAAETDGGVICRVWTVGTAGRFDLVYSTGGSLTMNAYDPFGTLLATTGPIVFNLHSEPRARRWSIEISESGANVNWSFACVDAKENPGGGYFNATPLAGRNVVAASVIQFNPGGVLDNVAIGHISIENAITNIFSDLFALSGNANETTTRRFRRLCDENGVKYRQLPEPPELVSVSTFMGSQKPGALVELLRECEKADQGIIFDGLSEGLINVARDYRENASAALTIDAAEFELAPEFEPDDDDQRTVNKARVTRAGGAEATYEDTDGPLGTAAVGVYDTSETLNLHDDSQPLHWASWLVHLGAVEGYRYPSISLDLRASPRLAPYVIGLLAGARIDITGVRQVLPDHPAETVSLVVEGVSMSISPYSWKVTFACSPYAPWRIVTLAADTGDTGENVLHLDTDGSELTIGADAGATSLTVTTLTGPVWTQLADDFPFDVAVGGVKVRVTNVTGASSPQTFTVDPLPVARGAHSPVDIWSQPALGLGTNS